MPINAALTGTEQTNLAGPTTVVTHLSAVANTVYATADVLSNPNFPVAGLAVTNTSVNWLTIPRNATVKITDSGGTVIRGYYRTRLNTDGKVSDTGILYINEIGQGDPGLLAQDIRVAAIQAGDKVTVYQNWNAWAILPRIVYSGGTAALIFEDFNQLYNNENRYPGPATAIIIKRASDAANGMPGAWAWRVDSGQSYATLQFNMVDYEWPSAGAVTYLATVPGSWTVTSGSVSSNQFTARVPAQADNYILKWVVSEANGGSTTRYIPIWVYDFVTYSPISITEVQSYTKDRTGARVSLGFNNNQLASIPDGTLVCMWDECTFNGTVVPSASRFVNGFVTRETRLMSPGLRGAELEIVGPGYLLQNMNANSQYFTAVSGTPASWQEITVQLSYLDFIVFWILNRRTTLLYIFDYVALGTSPTTWKMSAWTIASGTVLQQLQTQMKRCCGNIGSDAGGQFVFRQHPSMTTYSTRGAQVVTRDTLNASKYHDAPVVREVRPKYRKTRGEAFLSDGITQTAILSDAPDTVPSQGPSEDVLALQIALNQDEINERTGHWWSYINNPYSATITIPKNRDVIEPTHMQFISLTIPDYLDPLGVGYTKNVVPISVTKKYAQGGGYADVVIEAEFETAGLPGKSVAVSPPQTTLFGKYSELPITLSLPPTAQSSWGAISSFVPTQILAFGTKGTVIRVAGFPSTPIFTHVNMGSTIYTGLGGGSASVIDAIQDPFNAHRVIALGEAGIAILTNPFSGSASWALTGITPTAGYVFGLIGGFSGIFRFGKIEGSINVQNYFGWLEFPTSTPANVYYNYTTDNFATRNRVDLGVSWEPHPASSDVAWVTFDIGCFASAVSNMDIWANVQESVLHSSNGGASWSSFSSGFLTNAAHHGFIINQPYSKVGGGNNTSYGHLWSFEGQVAPNVYHFTGPNGDHATVAVDTNFGSGTARSVQSLTIDAKYLQLFSNTKLVTSIDGGVSWQNVNTFGGTGHRESINGWPTNPNFLLLIHPGDIGVTVNGGTTVGNVTGLAGELTVGEEFMQAFADFSEIYPVSGVHP